MFLLSAVNQDFFRAAAMRNPALNVAGKKDSVSFLFVVVVLLFGYTS